MLVKAIQAVGATVVDPKDLPFLAIKVGYYEIQEFVYDHFLKCWYNADFVDYSDVVNFDCYHPPHAYRYD